MHTNAPLVDYKTQAINVALLEPWFRHARGPSYINFTAFYHEDGLDVNVFHTNKCVAYCVRMCGVLGVHPTYLVFNMLDQEYHYYTAAQCNIPQ